MNLQRELTARILDLPDVGEENGCFATVSREFARFRGEGALHLRLTKERIKLLRPDYRLEIGFPPKDWLVIHFESEADLDYVMKLVEEAYELNA